MAAALHSLPAWLVLLGVLFALDAATTLYALAKFPRTVVEGNGPLAALMRAVGPTAAMLAVKAAGLAWVYWLNDGSDVYRNIMFAGAAGYVWVIVNNLKIINRQKA